jgi:hypothetical protein
MRKIGGLKATEIKFAVVEAALKRNQLAIGGTDVQRIARLQAFYREHTPKERLADCSVCDGISDIMEPGCPYCGDGAPDPNKLVQLKPSAIVMTPERELDTVVKRVLDLKSRTADALWELGEEIRKLYESQLWQRRTNDDGQQKYKQWATFVEAELGISNTYSYRLMDIATKFDREQVRAFGPTKLSMTLRVPDEEREKMLRAAAEGASVSQLRELARDIGVVAQGSNRGAKGGAGRHKRSKAQDRPRYYERYRLKNLLGRREMVPHRDGELKGNKIRMQYPLVCEEQIAPGLKQRFVLTNDVDGTLILIVERVRG